MSKVDFVSDVLLGFVEIVGNSFGNSQRQLDNRICTVKVKLQV